MPDKKVEEESNYFSYFKKLYESWERSTSQAFDLWLKSPLFKNSMDRALEKSVEFKNYIQNTMEIALQHRYVANVKDTDQLSDSLVNIQEKLYQLEEKIKGLENVPVSAGQRKRTKSKKAGRKKSYD